MVDSGLTAISITRIQSPGVSIMKNTGYKLALLLGGLFLIVAGFSPASAQDKEKKEVKKEVVVKVDEDGNIII